MKHYNVILWLKIGIGMILIMVMIGGITRLTGSGLSITEWRVVGGTLPPLSDTEWKEAFEKYQLTPEFKIRNYQMKLDGFKSIYFWEYFHRLWGRIMGFVFIIPFFYFFKKGYFKNNGLLYKILFVLILAVLQGVVGWLMVASGLVDQPHVSHFRLTAHLLMALVLLMYLMWLIYEIKIVDYEVMKKSIHYLNPLVVSFLIVVLLQLMYGGFMSGKKAALFYPSYPSMNGKMIPNNLFLGPGLQDFTENVTLIHFIHRLLPWIIVILFVRIWLKIKQRPKDSLRLKKICYLIGGLLLLQFFLGIKTVLLSEGQISVFWGSFHQIVGISFFLAAWWLYLSLTRVAK